MLSFNFKTFKTIETKLVRNFCQNRKKYDNILKYNHMDRMDGKMVYELLQYYIETKNIINAEILWNGINIKLKKNNLYIWKGIFKIFKQHYHKILELYNEMKQLNVMPNESILCVLITSKLNTNHTIYNNIVRDIEIIWNKNYNENYFIGLELMKYYVDKNDIHKLVHIFNSIHDKHKSIEIFKIMIKGYDINQKYQDMLELSLSKPMLSLNTEVSYNFAIKACVHLNDKQTGLNIYNDVIDKGYHNIELLNSLIHFCGTIHDIDKAVYIFNNIKTKHIVTYNCMMKSYLINHMYHDVLHIYNSIHIPKTYITYLTPLQACIKLLDKENGYNIYNEFKQKNYTNIEIYNSLIHFFGLLKDIEKCEELFNSMTTKYPDTYNSLMTAYIDNEMYLNVLDVYHKYTFTKTSVTYLIVLDACIYLKHPIGYEIYDIILNKNWNDVKLFNSLIHYFGTMHDVNKAHQVYSIVKRKDIVTHNLLMKAYMNNGMDHECIQLFNSNELKSIKDSYSYNIVITAIVNLKDSQMFQKVYKEFIQTGFNDTEVYNAMLSYYDTMGDIKNARILFDKIKNKNMVTYNTMMNCYLNRSKYQNAMDLFDSIHMKDNKGNIVYYNIGLLCCAALRLLQKGEYIIHEITVKYPKLLNKSSLKAGMITLYGKCDNMVKAHSIFRETLHNIVDNTDKDILLLYASMMDCYAKIGDTYQVLTLYNELKDNYPNIKISDNIYCIIINSCSHSGNMADARDIFNESIQNNDGKPYSYSLTAIIDCFSRKGYLDDAINIYHKYNKYFKHYHDKISKLRSILSGCKTFNDVKKAEYVVELIEQMYDECNIDSQDKVIPSCYVVLSNIYGQNKDYNKLNSLRKKIKKVK